LNKEEKLKKAVFIVLIVLLSTSVESMRVELMRKVKLSQENKIIELAASMVVTEDNLVIITDLKAGNLKIYSESGEFISTWGNKGAGPNEFLIPFFSDYQKGNLVIMDFGKRKNFVLERKGKTGLVLKKEFFCIETGDDIRIIGDQVLVSGHRVDENGEIYDLYIRNYENGKITFLLPTSIKYGFKSYKEFEKEDDRTEKFRTLSRVSYCDWLDNDVFYVWRGDLKIFKIDVNSKKTVTFGHKTSNYVKPYVTKEMRMARVRKERKKNDEEAKMSFIIGLFAGSHYLGLMYQEAPYNSEAYPDVISQFYTLAGDFINECKMPDKPTNTTYFNRSSNMLYSLAYVENEKSETLDVYVLQYRIIQ
jgi:hypothetical protein